MKNFILGIIITLIIGAWVILAVVGIISVKDAIFVIVISLLIAGWFFGLFWNKKEIKEDDCEYEMEYTREDELLERIAKLEKEISNLLSCKNCPDNKGGYICEKEYEGKCLSQKTQYIKELQEENKNLRDNYELCKATTIPTIKELQEEIAELKEELKKWKDEWQEQVQKENNESYARTLQTIKLTKAKKIIGNLYAICKDNHYPNSSVLMEQAEQFLKECE